jgi:hypothetical protein
VGSDDLHRTAFFEPPEFDPHATRGATMRRIEHMGRKPPAAHAPLRVIVRRSTP